MVTSFHFTGFDFAAVLGDAFTETAENCVFRISVQKCIQHEFSQRQEIFNNMKDGLISAVGILKRKTKEKKTHSALYHSVHMPGDEKCSSKNTHSTSDPHHI